MTTWELNVFHVNEQLFAGTTGQNAIPIFPSAPNEFFARVHCDEVVVGADTDSERAG
jgi:hypothetical protein